jgi:sterol 24-C-methyltransferase
VASENVDAGIYHYLDLHHNQDAMKRKADYAILVNTYYDLSTLFYEWGWGASFHFAYRYIFESFSDAIRRHEYFLASKLGLHGQPFTRKVLDVGCGIGGPMRNMCRFLQQDITGITLNQYQVDRGNELSNADDVVAGKCRSLQGDFMAMPFEDDVFDGAYAIEATCHAPDRLVVYSEVYRVLKPGSVFSVYEWCMTDEYIKGDALHERIKKQIEEGDGLPDICHTSDCLDAMRRAGFEILEERDLAKDYIGQSGKKWNTPLLPSWNPTSQRFQFNWLGFQITNFCVRALEFIWLAPKGSHKTQHMLQTAGYGLGQGGDLNIFTPMYLMVGRVPEDKTATKGL